MYTRADAPTYRASWRKKENWVKTVVVLFFFDISRDTDEMTSSLTSTTTHTHRVPQCGWAVKNMNAPAAERRLSFFFFKPLSLYVGTRTTTCVNIRRGGRVVAKALSQRLFKEWQVRVKKKKLQQQETSPREDAEKLLVLLSYARVCILEVHIGGFFVRSWLLLFRLWGPFFFVRWGKKRKQSVPCRDR